MTDNGARDDRTCQRALLAELMAIVGARHIVTDGERMAPYCTGFREGFGEAIAVVRPGTLLELWAAFKATVANGFIVITQAANTGLTGGSTPNGEYDRPVVVVNTMRIKGIFPIREAEQVLCLPGATLDELERVLAPAGREPHSVIGSSCLGASVIGGICNNSGGALLTRGPAYTQYALFAQVDAEGEIRLHNHLGIDLGTNPEEILGRLQLGDFSDRDVSDDGRQASASDYENIVRAVEEPTPARYNNDPRRLFEASGSAGKVMVFAVRLDSFPSAGPATTFYIGTNDTSVLSAVRTHLLSRATVLPTSAEYIHREAFDSAARYGKDTYCMIRRLGTARLPRLFSLKARLDRLSKKLPFLPEHFSDRVLQYAYRLAPQHLPHRIRAFRDQFEHHLIIKANGPAVADTRQLLEEALTFTQGAMFECSPEEAQAAFLHRFAVAGAAVRQQIVDAQRVEGIVALDIALPRNDREWFETLPPEIEQRLVGKLYYGHFFCHVFHQDYLVRKGESVADVKYALLALMAKRGARYPAEHNVGHSYKAEQPLADHYRSLDPTNVLNPGLGMTSRNRHWH